MNFARLNQKLVAAMIAGCGVLSSNLASADIVGGVDFGAGATTHLETTTLAETLVKADGDVLSGYGQVNTVNGNLIYAGANRLYFTFTNYVTTNFLGTSTDFTGGVINVFLGPTINLLSQSSAANIATIEGYGLWATLVGHGVNGTPYTLSADGTLVGATLSFTGQGLLDITGGLVDVVAFLNTSAIPDGGGGFADIALGTEGNNLILNPNDDTTGCQDGSASAGQFCIQGSASLRGPLAVVPEPGSMALVGIALFGLGVSMRKRKG